MYERIIQAASQYTLTEKHSYEDEINMSKGDGRNETFSTSI